MRTASRGRVCLVDDGLLYLANNEARFSGASDERECVPDLSDDLTRLGVLAVVRRAWGMPHICTYPVKMSDCAPWWNVGIPWSSESGGVFCATAPTELAALLGALEAAR